MTSNARALMTDPPPPEGGVALQLPWGLVGFEEHRDFLLVEEADSPIRWLQAVDEPLLTFPTIEPFLICPEYHFELQDAEVGALRLRGPADVAVLVILTFRAEPPGLTANLLAPVVVNRRERLARQVVLSDSRYALRHPVLPAMSGVPASRPGTRGSRKSAR